MLTRLWSTERKSRRRKDRSNDKFFQLIVFPQCRPIVWIIIQFLRHMLQAHKRRDDTRCQEKLCHVSFRMISMFPWMQITMIETTKWLNTNCINIEQMKCCGSWHFFASVFLLAWSFIISNAMKQIVYEHSS